jgi:hypothetical protein
MSINVGTMLLPKKRRRKKKKKKGKIRPPVKYQAGDKQDE